jgi:prepilin-type N-terminal cleavage/methylation domain-containing protein
MRKLKVKRLKIKERRAFTLVELIVSVGVFSIVMLVAVGALLSLLAANQRAQTLKVVMNNLNLAMESMVKDIRVGTIYHCGTGNYSEPADCSNGESTFAFRPSGGSAGDEIVYQLSGGAITRTIGSGASVTITSPDVTVEDIKFRVYGALFQDGEQPRVNIIIVGKAGVDEDTQTEFNIQSTATQRLIDS